MPQTEFDWTFDAIPEEGEDKARSGRPPSARRPGPPLGAPARRRRGRLLLGLLGLVVVAGLGLYAVYLNGWQRVRAQLSQEVAYEDTQSLAGNAEAVAALQWPDNKLWISQRAAEAALGWPARPPAEDLLPVPGPAQVLGVDTLATDLMEVTVLRRFADAAGRAYDFEYVQRYRRLGAGVWQRLAPAADPLGTTTVWAGRRLTVTMPVADEPWLKPLLPRLDHYLVRACADWQCPNDLQAPLTFSGRLEDMPFLAPARRSEAGPAGAQPYPITFDLIFRTPRYPRRVILPSLQLAGRPHDEAAQDALVRSTAVMLLAYVGAELAQSTRGSSSDYLDALIARAEIRLGLSPEPAWTPSPNSYLPPEALWPFSRIGETRARRANIPARLQALAFLNFVLGDSLPSADAALLKQIRFQPRLEGWLNSTLRVEGAERVEAWQARLTGDFAAQAPPRWAELEGLAYVCAEAAFLVRGGQPVALPIAGANTWLPREALSPGGDYLVVVESTSLAVSQIRVLNLSDGASTVVVAEGLGLPLGWTPAGDLLYLTQAEGPFSPIYSYELRLYSPGADRPLALSGEPLVTPWGHEQSWSADHSLMAITLVQGNDSAQGLLVSPGVIALRPPIQALRLPVQGYAAALAPDGQRLAYVAGQLSPEDFSGDPRGIDIINLTTQAVHGLLAPELSGQPAFNELNSLLWSPDGRQLAFLDYQPNRGAHVYLIVFNGPDPAHGGDLQLLAGALEQFSLAGFSADSRYLAGQRYDGVRSEMIVYDLESGATQTYLGAEASMPWSPRGHLLALAGPGGLYVVDPASGEEQWVTRGVCRPSWFALRRW